MSASFVNSAQSLSCDHFDSWVWAQTVFLKAQKGAGAQLDPDGNGIACDELLPVLGFAPATWTDALPDGVMPAQVASIADGDTLTLFVDGVRETVRLYRADTPETYFTPQCGGDEALAFTTWVLGFNDAGANVYFEQDVTLRDSLGRLLAYVWFVVDEQPYLLSEVLIRSGYAADVDFGDRINDAELKAAAEFAMNHELGVYELRGGFGLPDLEPDATLPTEIPTENCEPSYPTVCIPPKWEVGDLNCSDIPHRRFVVLPPNPHGFDGDRNGVGCEGYS